MKPITKDLAATNGHGEKWDVWKQALLEQLDDAKGKLEEQMGKVNQAREAIEAL